MDKKTLKVFAESKDKRIPQVTEAQIDFSSEGVALIEGIKIIGTDADVAMVLRVAEKDSRINNRRMFPLPEPVLDEEFFDEPAIKKEVK